MLTSRLFEMVYLLIAKKRMTAAALAAHFEVSPRTILRDVDKLSAAGIPVYTEQGKGGGIAIMEQFVLNKVLLSDEEIDQILFALQGLSAVNAVDAERVLEKWQHLFGKTDTSWIEVDFSRWGNGESDRRKFETLKRAILGRYAITFRYIGAYGAESERRAYPLKMVFKSKAWYLQAFCLTKADYRTFKINRMLAVTETDEAFASDIYTAPQIETTHILPESAMTLTLEFAPHVAYRVYDEFEEACIEKCDDGWIRASANMPEGKWLYDYIRSYGNDVRIISPEALKAK